MLSDLKNIKTKEINNNFEIYRFARIPFRIISSPFHLENTTEHHLGESNSAIALKKERQRISTLVISLQEQIFKNASTNLREWTST